MWACGKRRNVCNAALFISALLCVHSQRYLGRLAGVSPRTICRWASGEDFATVASLMLIVDKLFPVGKGAGPLYATDMAVDGNTRVGGVGEYSVRSAKGKQRRRYYED